MVWRNGFWPDNTVFIVVLFNSCCHCTAHTNSIAAHMHYLFFAVFVQIFCTQCFTVFCAQFEYLTYFNTTCRIGFLTAFRAWVFLGHHAQIIITCYFKVTTRIYIDKMICFFVGTAHQIGHLFYFQVSINFYIFQTNRA